MRIAPAFRRADPLVCAGPPGPAVRSKNRVLALLLLAVPAAFAQNIPHIAYVLPAGGRQGTTFEVQMGGQFLPNVSAASVSGRGAEEIGRAHV